MLHLYVCIKSSCCCHVMLVLSVGMGSVICTNTNLYSRVGCVYMDLDLLVSNVEDGELSRY